MFYDIQTAIYSRDVMMYEHNYQITLENMLKYIFM